MRIDSANIGGPREVSHFHDAAAFARFDAAYQAAFAQLPPSEATDVETAFGRVRCYRFAEGTGAPVVLIPGSGAATPMWELHLADLISLGRPVIALEPLGQAGASRQDRELTGADDQSRWLAELLEQTCPDGAHLVGASLGGWLSLHTALRYPERVHSATVIDPPAVFARLSATFLALGLGSAIPVLPTPLRLRMLAAIAGMDHADPTTPTARLSASAALDFRPKVPPPAGLEDDRLRSVQVPVLALIGGASRVHDPRRAARRAALLPQGQVEVWDGASHTLNVQQPERFAAAVRSFVGPA